MAGGPGPAADSSDVAQRPPGRYGHAVQKRLRIDVWSDIACPWCYIGKRHLEQALSTFEHAGAVDIVWRAFELDPGAPAARVLPEGGYAQRLARKYRVTPEEGAQMIDRVVDAAARAGIELRYDRIRPGNTFDAHRLLHWAREQDAQGPLKERLLRAYMTEGRALSDPDVLAGLAEEVGLPAAGARELLASPRYRDEVRADQALARELGIHGVPFFVMGGRLAVSGAQPAEVLGSMLEKAWADLPATEGAAPGAVAAASCGPDRCD